MSDLPRERRIEHDRLSGGGFVVVVPELCVNFDFSATPTVS
jgi:hypothetical protein